MDSRMQNIMFNYENRQLRLDDTFSFKCRECVKCCKNRYDIILTAQDLYNIGRNLGRTTDEIIKRYCDVYIGGSSLIPIVRLKPTDLGNACPLLRNKRCIVHNAKPIVCALFPLGRASAVSQEGADVEFTGCIQPKYFLQPVTCGSQSQTHTVRSWLEMFRLPVEDEFYSLWTSMIIFAAYCFQSLKEQMVPDNMVDRLLNFTFQELYMNYDTNMDFISQFQGRLPELKAILAIVKDNTEKLRGVPCGE